MINKELEAVVSYPNPATNELFIDLNVVAGLPSAIAIYDQFGTKIDFLDFESTPGVPIKFDIHAYPAALYVVMIQVEGKKMKTIKFVKQKM